MANQFIRESREIEYKKSESKLSKSFGKLIPHFLILKVELSI